MENYKVRYSNITPFEDIMEIVNILQNDPYIIGSREDGGLDFMSTSVLNADIDDEVSELEKYIMVDTMTPETTDDTSLSVVMVYSISVGGHKNNFGDIVKAIQYMPRILHQRDIGNSHELTLLDPPVKVATTKETILYIITFRCMATK